MVDLRIDMTTRLRMVRADTVARVLGEEDILRSNHRLYDPRASRRVHRVRRRSRGMARLEDHTRFLVAEAEVLGDQ